MEIKPIKRKSVVGEVYEQMKEIIISGDWQPESKIPSENELCKLFNVSRNTIRSAIQKFQTIGVLITNQGQGTFVPKSIINNLADSFIPEVYLSSDQIIEILEFRETIEIESVALAAIRANEADINAIKHSLDEMIENVRDYKKYSLADLQFHLNMARASHNSMFFRVLFKLTDILYNHFEEMNKDLGSEMSIENHKRIFVAVQNRDPELARYLLKENIELSMNKLKIKKQF